MNKDMQMDEALPHKKPGKSQSSTSPNRHGCEKNDFQAHEYMIFRSSGLTAPNFTPDNPPKMFRLKSQLWGYSRSLCIHCGKEQRTNKFSIDTVPDFNVIHLVNPSNDFSAWYLVELNADLTRITLQEKLDWKK